ncbi:ABC-type branched-chain amino acid transport systems ATPase, partial [Cupriavidus sp. HMR-1]
MNTIPSVPVLDAQSLTRRFGGLTAVNSVDLALHLHEIHAVIGTNGAGKSTLINLLSGELPPSEGRLQLQGRDVTGWAQPKLARHGIGRSYQRNNIFLPLTVRENCRLAAQSRAQRAWRLWEPAQG